MQKYKGLLLKGMNLFLLITIYLYVFYQYVKKK